ERAREIGKGVREFGILKILQPIGHSEMAKIDNDVNVHIAQGTERFIRKTPVIVPVSGIHFVILGAVTNEVDPIFFDELEIVTPVLVMFGEIITIPADGFSLPANGGVAAFKAGCKNKSWT